MSLRRILTAAALAHGVAATLLAQSPAPRNGRIVGRILDAATGAPIAGAQIAPAMSTGGNRVTSAIDGRYTLLDVTPGAAAIAIRAIGYSPKTVSGILVPEGGGVEQNVALAAQTIEVEGITVTAAAERGTVAAALDAQRDAPGIVNAVTAEEIARNPDGDAAQAVSRVSGVTVQDGRYVMVRGLGERYTTTSLNGARVPSPEPERRVVPLDLFPSSLLEAVTTSKTFTPDQPGDFSGAQVNLRTREFALRRLLSISTSAGMNDATAGARLPLAPTAGGEWLGFGARRRALPASVRDAPYPLQPADMPSVIGAFRNAWSTHPGAGGTNGGGSVAFGGEDAVFGRLIGYVASLSYSTATEVRRNEWRSVPASNGGGTTRDLNTYQGATATGSVMWGGIVNLTTRVGAGTKIDLNNTFSRGADNQATRLAAQIEEFAPTLFDVTRLTYTERAVRSNQLAGQHLVFGRHTVRWSLTSAGVRRHEPDRSDLVYEATRDSLTGAVTPVRWFDGSRAATRTFSDLTESSLEAALSWQLPLGAAGSALKVGGLWRTTDRDADTRAYDLYNQGLSDAERALPPEQLFRLTDKLIVQPNIFGGSYTASDRLGAGFAQLEWVLTHRLRLIGGARVERSRIAVDTREASTGTIMPARLATTDVLPSLAFTAQLTPTQQLRASVSQTLSRPEYRELSSVEYFDILGGLRLRGDTGLMRSLIRNADLRWEWYPRSGEVVSVALFAKQFDRPIERVLVQSTGAMTVNFVNARSAQNYGIELELRRGFGASWTAFTNATLMRSTIRPGAETVSALTNTRRPMVGQSAYVVNAGLGWAPAAGRFTATALYNVVGRRIAEAGASGFPDSWEKERHVVDLALRYRIGGHTGLKLDARNLLDAPFVVTQGAVTRLRYTVGRSFNLGLSWER